MKIWSFFLSTVVVFLMSLLGNFIYVKILKRDLFGGLHIGFLVGLCGCILGGFVIDQLFKLPFLFSLQSVPYIKYLLVNKLDVNFIASSLGIGLFLWMYDYVSVHTERS